jgi:hypothetical protein
MTIPLEPDWTVEDDALAILLKIAKFCTLILKSKLLGPQVEQ